MAESEQGSSPLAEALAKVGDRWTLLVVEALLAGPRRFNDLLGQIPGIAANILSDRLKRLEREALLVARPYSERPPRATYQLTAEGRELAGALRLLAQWGASHADPADAPRHPASLAKLMTLYLAFEALRDRRISLDSLVPVSDYAASMEPTKLGLTPETRITVADVGAGIPPDKLDSIFDRFRQADQSLTRGRGGVGLGLYIVKSLVDAHNGTIEVSSEEGKGTSFVIRMPKRAEDRQQPLLEAPPASRPV